MLACRSPIIENRTVNSSAALFCANNSLSFIHSSASSCSETPMLWFVTLAWSNSRDHKNNVSSLIPKKASLGIKYIISQKIPFISSFFFSSVIKSTGFLSKTLLLQSRRDPCSRHRTQHLLPFFTQYQRRFIFSLLPKIKSGLDSQLQLRALVEKVAAAHFCSFLIL